MATGDSADMAGRMAAVLPARWFPPLAEAPVLNGLLTGIGQAWAFCYGLIGYAAAQNRLSTATGAFLDMIAADFFGGGLLRAAGESDAQYGARIAAALLGEQATRSAVSDAVSTLTGASVEIFEPMRPADTGGYAALAAPGIGGGGGYGSLPLRYGSLAYPYQCFIDAARPTDGALSIAVVPYGSLATAFASAPRGGYGAGAAEYAPGDALGSVVTDATVEAAVAAALPACTIGWIRLT